MRISLLFFMSFYACIARSQVKETFDDGNWNMNPTWNGSTTGFTVNAARQLQTTGSSTSQSVYLSTASSVAAPAAWEFYLQLNFSPSANNLVKIYLTADQPDLLAPLNGYFLQVGETGNADSYDLFKQTGTSVTRILAGKDQVRTSANQLIARIRVTCSAGGFWEVSSDNTGGHLFELSGSSRYEGYVAGGWFGIVAKYTAGNADKFILDDIDVSGTVPLPTKKIEAGEILISEVLFNPRPGGADFVEIYNPTGNLFALHDLSIATVNAVDSLVSSKPVTAPGWILPGQYYAFTVDPANIRAEYLVKDSLSLIKMAALPAFNNDAGTVVLVSNGKRIDRFDYAEKMHFPLIKNKEGVSLERSSFERKANEPGNFRSAAGASGFATPGYQNSQFIETRSFAREVQLSSVTFSPDNDGFEDELQVNYQFSEAGKMANATIYSDKGIRVCRLIKNTTIPAAGAFTWNGLNEGNEKQPVGIYWMVMEVVDGRGKVERYRQRCVLATRL